MFAAIILTWIAAGAIVGFIASKLVDLRGDDIKLGLGAAVLGAVVGGIAYGVMSGHGITHWTVWGAGAAAIGAVVGSAVWHIIRSRTISHEKFSARRSY